MARLIKLYSENTSEKELRSIASALEGGAIIIYPTDTLYALGCSLNNIKAISKIKEIKRKSDDNLSLVLADISSLSEYARIDNTQFKLIKRNTPGAFTFILDASKSVPNKFLERKSSVGVRIPDNNITRQIVEALGSPLVSTSITIPNLELEDFGDPELIWEECRDMVDIMIDGGFADVSESTIVDLTDGEPEIVRQGAAELEL